VYGRLRVDVLGPLRAWLGDTEVVLGTARQRATFAALVGSAAEGLSRHDLIGAVWGVHAPATATGNLHTYVSGLRRALGPARDLLVTTPRGYRLDLDSADVDGVAFETLCADADRRVLAGDVDGAVDSLTRGLALWKGDAYSGVPGPLAELEGHRLGQARTAAIECRTRLLVDSGHQVEVIADAVDLVREQPLRESAWELLVLALHRCGRHAEALATAEQAKQTLARELGVLPGPALAELDTRINADARTASGRTTVSPRRVPGPVVPAAVHDALTERPRRTLVGRGAAVEQLRSLVADVSAGTGGAVWIESEAGMGKSALLTAGLADARDLGCSLGWAHADELLGRFDLQVLMNCFDIDLLPGGRLAPGRDEDDVGDRLVDLIVRTCARAPLIVVIDDVHRADGATMRLWQRLVLRDRDLPLLLIATSCPHRGRLDLARLRQAVSRTNGRVLDLAPLTTCESEHLVRTTAGGCSSWTAERLAVQGAGNPLRLVELGRALRRRRTPGSAVQLGVTGTADVEEVPAPRRTTATAARRTLLSLSCETTGVLRAASVLGVEFSESDLTVVSDLAPVAVRAALDEAVAAQVIVAEQGVLAFRTDPLWRAAYERVPAPIRTPLRRQYAEMLMAAVVTGPTSGSNRAE
jgi:DNA-binding SARP family transcriptional activator